MAHVVAASESGVGSDVVYVDFRSVARHGGGHSPQVGVGRAQELIPQPEVAAELGIVPGIAAHIVAPRVAHGVVGMHYVAVVPEAIPAVFLYGVLIEVGVVVEAVFHYRAGRSGAVGQSPYSEGLVAAQIVGSGKEHALEPGGRGVGGEIGLASVSAVGANGDGRSARYAVGSAHPLLHVFIA